MIRLIQIFIIFTFCNLVSSQIFMDTLYVGKTFNRSKNSISSKLIDKYKEYKFCDNNENVLNKYISKKSFVPFILRSIYEKKRRNAILNFESVIYTHFCNCDDYIYETIFMEIFFDIDENAKNFILALEEYVKIYDYEKKNDLVAHVGTLNWFYTRKGNVVYFVHRRMEDTDDYPIVETLKKNITELLEN